MSELADLLKTPTPLGIRIGIVTAVIDSRHVMVDIGERSIGAAWPASLGTPVADIDVTLVVGDGVARVITSSRAPAEIPAQTVYAMASESATLTFSASGTASVDVAFPTGRFTVTPRFMAYIRSPGLRVIISATNESITGGRINGAVVGTMTGSVSVGWLAWQRTATSKD